jgi:hypothetical protein
VISDQWRRWRRVFAGREDRSEVAVSGFGEEDAVTVEVLVFFVGDGGGAQPGFIHYRQFLIAEVLQVEVFLAEEDVCGSRLHAAVGRRLRA